MKSSKSTPFILFFCISFTSFVFAQGSTNEAKSLRDFIKKPVVDEFNDRVSDAGRKNPQPKPGGQVTIRIPVDPKGLNPITDNDAQSQLIQSYLFDSLITRDPETLEWLPWIAVRWEERDRIILKNGNQLEGHIIKEDEKEVLFAENLGKMIFGKHDIAQCDTLRNELTLKEGKKFTGIIKELQYTIELEPNPVNSRSILLSDIALQENSKEKKAILKHSVYYFTIRNNVMWHDGTKFTLDDVLFSYHTIMNKYVDAAPLRTYYVDIKEVTKISDDTIKFVYGKSYFLSLSICGGMPIFPKHVYNPDQFSGDEEAFGKYFNQHEANRHPIGNSAYRFVSWDKGKNIIIEKVPDYWGSQCGFPYWKKEQPYLEKIIWTVINNKTASLKELQNENIDADFDIEPDIWFSGQTTSREFTSRFVRAEIIVPLYSYIGWNIDTPYFHDKRVRQAMSHLVPLDKIAQDIHHNLVIEVTGPFFVNGPVYDHSLKPYAYSLHEAKKLLREAGWLDHDGDGILDKDGIKFEFEYLIHNGRDYHQKIADIIKESIEQAGIKMLIRKIDWTIFSETVSDRKFDAVRFAWGTDIDGDQYQLWHSSQIGNRGSNFVGYRNSKVDKILEDAREIFDPEKRWALYRQLHHILYEDQPYTFLFCFKTLFFYNKKFQNVKLYCTQPGYNLREWYINEPDSKK